MDWNCRLFPEIKDQMLDPSSAVEGMCEMANRFSVDRFCLLPDFDPTKEALSIFLLRRSKWERAIQSPLTSSTPSVKVKMAARAILTENLYQEPLLHKLVLPNGYLALSLPVGAYSDWIDQAINRLLYQANMTKLILTSFDLCVMLYPDDVIQRLLRIPHLIIQINYASLTDPKIQRLIPQLMRQNRIILLGTSINSLDRVYHYEFDYYTKSATDHIPIADYQTMLRRSNRFWLK